MRGRQRVRGVSKGFHYLVLAPRRPPGCVPTPLLLPRFFSALPVREHPRRPTFSRAENYPPVAFPAPWPPPAKDTAGGGRCTATLRAQSGTVSVPQARCTSRTVCCSGETHRERQTPTQGLHVAVCNQPLPLVGDSGTPTPPLTPPHSHIHVASEDMLDLLHMPTMSWRPPPDP